MFFFQKIIRLLLFLFFILMSLSGPVISDMFHSHAEYFETLITLLTDPKVVWFYHTCQYQG